MFDLLAFSSETLILDAFISKLFEINVFITETLILDAFKTDVFEIRAFIKGVLIVDALIVEPVSVENWLRFKLGTMIVDATKVHTVSVELMFALLPINVDTINVLFMNDVFKVIVDTKRVDAIIDEPVMVEN